MNQTTGRDDFFNTTIIESLADDVTNLQVVCRSSIIDTERHCNIGNNLGFLNEWIFLFKGHRESFSALVTTLVPMNRPSSEPLPLVFAVAMTLKPAVGWTNFPIFLRKTPFPSGYSRQRILLSKVDLVKVQDADLVECFNDWSHCARRVGPLTSGNHQ